MGKRLRSQKRGKGSPAYQAVKIGVVPVSYVDYNDKQKNDKYYGEVADLFTDSAHLGVLVRVVFEDYNDAITIAAEGIRVGQKIVAGKTAEISIGNIVPLSEVMEGCPIFNVEMFPGDGGKLIRSSGLYGLVVTRDAKTVTVKLPSGKTIELQPECRCTIGCVAGGGREEKPFLKAGNAYHLHAARRKHYPGVRGVAMNPVDHPFGGSQHHPGKSKSTSRNAPPGRKVGAIASSRTGRRKKN